MATDLIERLAAYRPVLDEAIESDLAARQPERRPRPRSMRVVATLVAVGLVAVGVGALAWTRADQPTAPSDSVLADRPVATVTDTNPVGAPAPSTPSTPSTTEATEATDAPRPTEPAGAAAVIDRLAIGDSVMLGATASLVESGFVVDAAESRQFRDGAAVIESLDQQGRLGQVVVVHLGTNGTIDEVAFTNLMESLADVPQVVLLTSDLPREWTAGNNVLIYDAVNDHPNVVLLDWAGLDDACPGDCFASDGFHLRPDGQRYYARLIDEVLRNEYVVQVGDYPVLVAEKFCTTLSELVAANEWSSAADLPYPGTIVLPPRSDHPTCPDPAS